MSSREFRFGWSCENADRPGVEPRLMESRWPRKALAGGDLMAYTSPYSLGFAGVARRLVRRAGRPSIERATVAKNDTPRRHGLTKADLIDAVYDRHGGLTKSEATEIVDAIFKTVKTTLGGGRPVRIKNFGSFEVTTRPGRVGVNPTSGEKITIPPHKGLSFRPARQLRSTLGKRDRDEP